MTFSETADIMCRVIMLTFGIISFIFSFSIWRLLAITLKTDFSELLFQVLLL